MCNPTPSAGWIGVIAALVGAIVGGGIAALISYLQTRTQRARETKKLLLSKLEETHEALSRLRFAYKKSLSERFATVAGIKREMSGPPPIERLQMAINRMRVLQGKAPLTRLRRRTLPRKTDGATNVR